MEILFYDITIHFDKEQVAISEFLRMEREALQW